MLKIILQAVEYYDEVNEQFIYEDPDMLTLEHSLVSISKWESTWNKPFLDKKEKSVEEIMDYIRCMDTNENDPSMYKRLTRDNISDINKYIEAPMTATTFTKTNDPPNREIITSELMYYWMVSYNIPFECQHWHLNRLLTLIRVCNIKNNPPKKMSKRDTLSRNRDLNKARKQQLNTNG